MRKKVLGRQLSRGRKGRTALFKSLIRAIVLNGKIKTTKAKALSIQPELDKLMGLIARDTVEAKRLILKQTGNNKNVLTKLMSYKALAQGRTSGFTKSIALPRRKGDNAELTQLEWVATPITDTKKTDTKKKVVKKRKSEK